MGREGISDIPPTQRAQLLTSFFVVSNDPCLLAEQAPCATCSVSLPDPAVYAKGGSSCITIRDRADRGRMKRQITKSANPRSGQQTITSACGFRRLSRAAAA